jgi:hypothetical protein
LAGVFLAGVFLAGAFFADVDLPDAGFFAVMPRLRVGETQSVQQTRRQPRCPQSARNHRYQVPSTKYPALAVS